MYNDFKRLYTFKKGIKSRRNYNIIKIFLLISLIFILSIACSQSFYLVDSLDGSEGLLSAELSDTLTISPSNTGLFIGTNAIFSAAGGEPPYIFSLISGIGTITSTGLYTAPLSSGNAVIEVIDNNLETAQANITVTDVQNDVDYIVQSISNTPSSADINDTINQSFIIKNQGTDPGSSNIYWTAFISTDQQFSGDDTFISSGFSNSLAALSSSGLINISGNWPGVSGIYYLIVNISAADELNPSNNYGASPSFTIIPTGTDIDYIVTELSRDYPIITSGSLCAETFKIINIGGLNGTDDINWHIYSSTDQILDAGDIEIEGNTVSALNTGQEVLVTISQNWTNTPGSYYLIAKVDSLDETVTNNNTSNNGVYTLYNPPDYIITNNNYQLMGNPGTLLSTYGIYDFTILENSGNSGSQPISWKVYLSYDMILDESDLVIKSANINSLTANGSSIISYSDQSWPVLGSNYHIIIYINSGDDSNTTNNLFVSAAVSVPDTYTEAGEDNSSFGPVTGSLPNVTDLAPNLQGGILSKYELMQIDGLIDNPGNYDTYKVITGPLVTSIDMNANWATGFNDIDIALWDESNSSLISNSTQKNKEPNGGIATFPVTPDTIYYIGISFTALSTLNEPYTISIQGK